MSTQKQGVTLFTALATFIAILVIVQLWLVAAAVDALILGDTTVLIPAAIASVVLSAIDFGLLLHGLSFDRRLAREPRRE